MWMRMAPGSVLDEVALAEKYEVSRTPIREALLLLSKEGFVQFLPNRSTIVAPMTLDNIPAWLDTFLLLSRSLVRTVAMKRPGEPEPLLRLLDAYETGLGAGDVRPPFQAQLDLYRELAARAENRFLEKYFLEAQDASVRLKQLHFFPHLGESDRERAVRRLRAVVETVSQGDPDAADTAVTRSILFEARIVRRSLGPTFGHRMVVDAPLTDLEDPE